MKAIIDRFEGNYAVCECEDKKMIIFDKSRIPVDAVEGSVLEIEGNEIVLNWAETNTRRERINKKMDDLWV